MKLSEAIRLGAMLRPQGFDGLAVRGTSCALVAASEAAGIPLVAGFICDYAAIRARWPVLLARVRSPRNGTQQLEVIIWLLNDSHHWTREAIADFVEQIERQHEPALPFLTEGTLEREKYMQEVG